MHSVMINKRRNIHRNVLNPNNRRKQKSVLLTYQQLYDNLYGHEKEKKKKTEALRLQSIVNVISYIQQAIVEYIYCESFEPGMGSMILQESSLVRQNPNKQRDNDTISSLNLYNQTLGLPIQAKHTKKLYQSITIVTEF